MSLLLGLGDVHPFQVEGEAGGRQLAAEAPEQPVVAAAAAEDVAERRVVDLEDRAGVVAEVAQQAQVELNAVRDAPRGKRVVGRAQPLRGALHRLTPELGGADRGPRGLPACPGSASRVARASEPIPSHLVDLHLEPDEVVCREAVEDARPGVLGYSESSEQLAVQVGVTEADDRPVEPGGVECAR